VNKAFWNGFWCGANPLVAVAWLLYGLGHGSYLLLCLNDESERWVQFWFRPYQCFMRWSEVVQGNSKCGPWGDEFREEIGE
jgi:hypothetical protein